MKENANSRRNMQVVGDMYARVMRALAEKEGKGESYPSLKEAPVERLPYLVEKFIQAARKSNMEVYASGTFHFIWNRVANILSSRETDPVNVKTDVNFRCAREILAKKANESAQAGRPPGVDSKKKQKSHMTSSQDRIWRFRLLCCWSTNHKSYCGGMWT